MTSRELNRAVQADTIHHLPEHLVLARAQAIADLVLALGQVNRATEHPDGTPETDTTHTVMLALIAADLAPHAGLDRGEVAIYALVHDLVEAYAGDTSTARSLDREAAAAKAAREAAALARIKRELAGSPWLIEAIESYEAQAHPAARWVRYLDKVTPKLTHRRNGCRAVKAIGMSRDEVLARHEHQGAELRARYPDMPLADHLFRAACNACELAFNDAPAARSSRELIAAFKALDAREEAAHREFWQERVRLTAALRAAEAEELRARIERLLRTWPADVLDALRGNAPPLPRTSAYTALARRRLVHAAEFPRTGVTVVSWTHQGLVARKLLEVP